MPKTAAEIETLTKRRKTTVARSSFNKPIDAWTDPETGAGVVISERPDFRRKAETEIYAHFFRPRAVNRSFREEKITSNHARIGVRDRLKSVLDEEKAAKVAPHDLKVGEVLANIWGATMQDVSFWQVVGIPSPRKVQVVKLGDRITEGDWMAGKKVPIVPEGTLAEGQSRTLDVSMASGSPMLRTGSSIERFGRWDGNPVMIYSD